MRRLRLRRPVERREIGLTLREGAPLGAMSVVETASVSVATLMIGGFGTVALAANQVAQSIGGLLYMLPLGVAGAVAIRVAQERGAGNGAALRPIALAAVSVAMVWLVAAALLLVFRGEAVARLVIEDPEVVALDSGDLPRFRADADLRRRAVRDAGCAAGAFRHGVAGCRIGHRLLAGCAAARLDPGALGGHGTRRHLGRLHPCAGWRGSGPDRPLLADNCSAASEALAAGDGST